MTEAEMIEAGTSFYELSATMLSLYLTATTGYLLVAFFVGIKLTRIQLVTISGLYLIFALISTYMAVGYGIRGISYMELVAQLNTDTELYTTNALPIGMAICLLGGIFASLYFMWSVRHPKEE